MTINWPVAFLVEFVNVVASLINHHSYMMSCCEYVKKYGSCQVKNGSHQI